MKLFVKDMVCQNCIILVQDQLKNLNILYVEVYMGVIELLEEITPEKHRQLKVNLQLSDLELLDNKKSILAENIKTLIIDMIHYRDPESNIKYAEYLSEKSGFDFIYIDNVYSKENGNTIVSLPLILSIRIKLYNEGVVVDSGIYEQTYYDSTTWTPVSILVHNNSIMVDSAYISIDNQPMEDQSWHRSSLHFDDLSFDHLPLSVLFYSNPVTTETTRLEITGVRLDKPVVQIIDARGRLMNIETTHKNGIFTIDTDGLAKGLFFYHVTDGNRLDKSGKFVVP